ncbi:MAG: protein-glutamate O-methyltransferase CheR [Thermodesulfobacteriota bacterium]
MIKVSPEEFQLWAGLIYEYTGIVLQPGKAYLIENRLSGLLQEYNCQNFKEMYFKARHAGNPTLKESIINNISTQETSFFRDRHVYDALADLIRNKISPAKRREAPAGRPPKLRIWSAACSHGQEPYSAAMILAEVIPDIDDWDLKLLATDISDKAFRKASLGRYTELEVQRGLDQHHLGKYFVKRQDGLWQVSDRIRAMISFQKVNLVTEDYRSLGTFDLIFCRNVAIYFDLPTKTRLFGNLERVLAPQGYLIVGSTENISPFVADLRIFHHRNAIFYLKNGQARSPAVLKTGTN